MKMMKHILYILLVMLLAAPAPVVAQQKKASTQMSAAQKQREKAKAKREKEKAKAAAQKAKEQAKRQKEKDKVAAQKQKEAEKKEDAKLKAEMKKAGGDRQMMAKTKEAADRIAKRTSYHHLAMWGGAGYSGLIGKVQGIDQLDLNAGSMNPQFVGGGGGMIGLGYELHHKKFIFKVGPEFRIFSSQNKLNYTDPFETERLDYHSMVQHYQMDKFRENATVGQVMVPIMFGANFDKVYFLVGAKVGYTILSNYQQKGTLTTTVTEHAAFDDWGEMMKHSLESAELSNHSLYSKGGEKGKFDMGVDVAVSAEVGLNINEFLSDEWNSRNEERRFPWRMRVAAFVDYGLPLTSAGGDKTLLGVTDEVYNNAKMLASNSVYQTAQSPSKLSSLLVGVKFTALLQLNKPKTPDPFICFMVTDTVGRPTRSLATVAVSQPAMPKRKPKMRKMNKEGKLDVRYPKDTYAMIAQAAGYLPSNYNGDTLILDHIYDGDSAIFRLIPVPALVTYVVDKESGKNIAAKVEYIDLQNEAHNATGEVNGDTPHAISLHYGDRYLVRVSAPGYHADSTTISNLTDTIHVTMRPIHRLRHKLVLKHMYFAVDKTEILPGSEEDIETLYNFLVDNPRIRVMITGHTDSDGDEQHNQILSEGRAASLRNLMIERGINPARLESEGKGESEPIDTNLTDEGKQNNRRVEVTVLNADEAEEDVW